MSVDHKTATAFMDDEDYGIDGRFKVRKYQYLVAVAPDGVAHSVLDVFRRVKTGLRVQVACGPELFSADVTTFDASRSVTCIGCLVAAQPLRP